MSSLPKFAVVSLVVIAIGALQFAVPAFTNKQNIAPTSNAIGTPNTQQNSTLSNQPVGENQNTLSGTLYFIKEHNVADETSYQHLQSPVLKTKVDIKVTGIIARTTVTQTFKNAGKDWVDALYVFPLPENAAVDHLLMTVGERKIEGVIKEKAEAKKIYLQAKAQGKKASLVAQQRPNMFSNSIANIGPGEMITVNIEYQQKLNFEQQQYSLRFPMTITPRYMPNNTSEDPKIPVKLSPSHPQNSIELQVNLHAGFEVQDIKSEFHPITVTQLSDGSQNIRIQKDTVANQDFVLNWRPEFGAAPQSGHFTQLVNGDEYGLVMLLPPVKNDPVKASQLRDVIFVLDTSGSMEGDSIQQAKTALLLAIDQLKVTDTFNIIEFNSYAQNLWKIPKPAHSNNKQEAIRFVNSLSANGGTEMQSALKLAFSQPKVNEPNILRQIIFITDGSVGNEESLMQLIHSRLENSRLFTVGIGSAPNSYFMSEAAKMGRGTFTYIGAVNQVQEKMQSLLTKLQHPAITDIELQLNARTLGSNQQLEFYPNVISDLYRDEPLVLSYRLTNSKIESDKGTSILSKVNLSARYQGKAWENPLVLNAQTRQSGLNVLWAREKISQLTRDKRQASMRAYSSGAEQDEYKSQITDTALSHHLVSQYTSLVAVDVTPTRPTEVQSKSQKVANSVPSGTSNQRIQAQGTLPQTATLAQLKIIFGLILIGLTICMHLLIKRKAISQSYYS
ncbi:marine proteobacterial sortase target protein [uncultured Paraglaciecola sp.]|uniref:marine proteobacterial sortase target protein n=1 Tax=uncultured Paraglaciecola sp. TaxID=1765024 RepID=UPI0030D986F4|tara:strand:+ start:189907 stop:192096 length:2190 start_codon:yes stop_codon:yes gene_type:complete